MQFFFFFPFLFLQGAVSVHLTHLVTQPLFMFPFLFLHGLFVVQSTHASAHLFFAFRVFLLLQTLRLLHLFFSLLVVGAVRPAFPTDGGVGVTVGVGVGGGGLGALVGAKDGGVVGDSVGDKDGALVVGTNVGDTVG